MLLTNISKLIPIEGEPIEKAALQITDGKIKWFGPESKAPKDPKKFDGEGCVVTPGLVDCHTHLVHAGSRQHEYQLRSEGKSYLEIAKAGGGILSTVQATRAAPFEQLYLEAAHRVGEAMIYGTTTIEIKSGYGLDVATELKMLEVIQQFKKEIPINIVSTFLGGHTIPKEYQGKRNDYVALVIREMLPAVAKLGGVDFCDIFVEASAFSAEEARQILSAAKKIGLKTKFHVDQLTAGKGAELAAELGAISADHLEQISEEGIRALKNSGTVAVLLPGASFFLGVKPAPARKLLDVGIPVAIATDYNPGTNPCLNLMLTATFGIGLLKMTAEEVWRAITINAAKALGLEKKVGSIAVGKQADLVLWDAPDEIYPLYRYSKDCVAHVFAKGQKVC